MIATIFSSLTIENKINMGREKKKKRKFCAIVWQFFGFFVVVKSTTDCNITSHFFVLLPMLLCVSLLTRSYSEEGLDMVFSQLFLRLFSMDKNDCLC